MGWLVLALLIAWLTGVCLALRRLPRPARLEPRELPPLEAPPLEPRVLRATDSLTVRERLPVVLVHGFGGWDELAIGEKRHAYFRGVRERLARQGLEVRAVRLPPIASLEERALALACQLPLARRVHLIAHSMGGVDARLALARFGAAERVATLVTVGAPHKGTPIAELAARLARRAGTWRSLARALEDLGTERMTKLDEELRDIDRVRYASVIVRPKRGARGCAAALVPSYWWLERRAGPSDGVVPARSQAHGRVLGEIDTDHWGAIGWGSFDAPSFYARLALALANDDPLDRV